MSLIHEELIRALEYPQLPPDIQKLVEELDAVYIAAKPTVEKLKPAFKKKVVLPDVLRVAADTKITESKLSAANGFSLRETLSGRYQCFFCKGIESNFGVDSYYLYHSKTERYLITTGDAEYNKMLYEAINLPLRSSYKGDYTVDKSFDFNPDAEKIEAAIEVASEAIALAIIKVLAYPNELLLSIKKLKIAIADESL